MEELALSGYDDRKPLLAQRFDRAGTSLFVVALPIHLVATHLPCPDPEEPFEGNRRVNSAHAPGFGTYWRHNEKWATPPLLLDTTFPLSRDFEARFKAGGVEFGVLYLPPNSAAELEILDGQHRILGWRLITERILNELKATREQLAYARAGKADAEISRLSQIVKSLDGELARMRNEYITAEILEGVSSSEHKQYFHDIAVNAKGITKSVTVGFDRRNLLNRVAMSLADSEGLLKGRVDLEKDRVTGSNPNFLSNANVVDLVRAVAIGVNGRMTPRREEALTDEVATTMTSGFLRLLKDNFPDLRSLADGLTSPVELRRTSMLGSVTVLRVLAGAYHLLAVDLIDGEGYTIDAEGHALAERLFSELSTELSLPISGGWYATGYFATTDSNAPLSRAQDLAGLASTLAWWAEDGIYTSYEEE